MAPTTTRTKRKPPTFNHLPEHAAKRFKREWVEKQKIKSKWKAQKRKEGIVTRRDAASSSTHKAPEEDQSAAMEDDPVENNASGDSEASEESDAAEESDASEDGVGRDSEGLSIRSLSPPRTHPRDQPPPKEEDNLSLRELQSLAYSRSSLHHYKSDPLHRSRGRGGSSARGRGGSGRGAERGRGRGGGAERGGGRGRGRGRGGGQPDMRLRMNALLQQVKQNFEN
ncbi:hypothetical protein EVG20_g609 [Dentipellis fragilis]|uniref:rRNA-processing protein FYV7 n=1 Tax=Dentipellis fragilis TaxID=205917 RepID=A0A4Y9ZES9_9AGAM|nr:hypothetical protein EVG20_g609 [Dentipellis fragilis]